MLVARTLKVALLLVFLIGTVTYVLARPVSVGMESAHHHMLGIIAYQDDPDAQAMIENAMSAAPTTVSHDATILANELDEDGKFIVLREGTNGWYCQPDLEATPSNDPVCFDDVWLEFTYTFIAGEEPNITRLGLAYMLQGGSDASNIDPFVLEPQEGAEWITTPPHIMLLVPGLDVEQFGTDHMTGRPWVMWAGTPYEHIMMPVAETEQEHDE